MSYLFIHYKNESGRLYFFDLIGAAAGAFFSVVIIESFGAIDSLILTGIIPSIALILVSDKKRLKISMIVLVILVSLLPLNSSFRVIGLGSWSAKKNELFVKWNSFSMVRVWGNEARLESGPFGWGMSPLYEGPYPPKLNMLIDRDAYTPIIKFDGDFEKVQFLKHSVTSLSYHIENFSDALIIGPGGGWDVLMALTFGCEKVVGVEVNPIIVNDIMKERFREYSGNLYLLENVEIVVDDARSYIRNSRDKYDVIQASVVDTFAATGAGALSLAENNLYTVEAVTEYINHLSSDGFLTITRWHGPASLRLAILYIKAAEKLGITNPDKHIIVVCARIEESKTILANVIFKKSGFTNNEIARISNLSAEMGFEIYYRPNFQIDNEYNQIINSNNSDEVIASYRYDIRPTTDDRPFFFSKIKLGSVPSVLLGTTKDYGIFFLYSLLIIASFLSLGLIIFPLYLNRKDFFRSETKSKLLYLMYFSLLGISFMMIEISFIQKFMLFLGHPTYSVLVIISSFLLFAGIGSLLSNRISQEKLKSWLKIILLVAIGIMVLYNLSLYSLFNRLLGLEINVRILISIILLSILGIFMGMPFPTGIKLLGLKHKELIPFSWSLNGAFSVLSSILAVVFSMNVGFTITIFLAAVLYLFAFIVSSFKSF